MNAELQARSSRFNLFPASEYDNYVAGHPEATPYHSSAWLQAAESSYGHPGWLVTVNRNGHLCGVLPLLEVKRPFGAKSLVSLPFCDLGGVLADNEEIKEWLIAEAWVLADEKRINTLEIREGGSVVEGPQQSLPVGTKVRMLCDLPDTSEALFKSYKPKLRSQIRKAEKNGLRAELRTDADAVNLFYQVFTRNMRRLGSPVHSAQWFQELKAAYGDSLLVGLVFHNGQPVAAGIVLLAGKEACIPWASTLEAFNRLAPNMLLYWTLLSHVCDAGCSRFDFGRSTIGEGTYRFKKQWGAEPHGLNWAEYRGGITTPAVVSDGGNNAAIASRLRPFIEGAWRQLPLPIANWLGPKLRRYITL
ncbi:FemAB family XrtA/PEP-CTERM system-associated protein [Marinobacter piscensis]|uniref:FemAB family XrtA/PEP-CTERM system-associated protein n=1 Tax=Marinobacter piscensis TaxID=1562308 RepID=UPI00119CEE6F|nr:FemAB family XrtA/PEP-CTERM system-associated protein [Marinobacter piscensis]